MSVARRDEARRQCWPSTLIFLWERVQMAVSIVRVGACQGCRRCTARDTGSLSLSLSLSLPLCARENRVKCIRSSRSRVHTHMCTHVCTCTVILPCHRRQVRFTCVSRGTCTRVASDRCAVCRRQATYVIPVTRFSNGGNTYVSARKWNSEDKIRWEQIYLLQNKLISRYIVKFVNWKIY